jgi:menaquinone-dependent protoporphyrinogen oxidase
MSKILIASASTHGHTAKIASCIAEVLRSEGHDVDVHDDVAATDPSPAGYDAVIVGASIHAGRHQQPLVQWARRHGTSLTMTPSAFFSVSMTAAEDTDEARERARGYLDDFEEHTDWTPRLRTSFGGALQYREYGFMTRLIVRAISKHEGRPTDTKRDYDFTDWGAVTAFARTCAKLPAAALV